MSAVRKLHAGAAAPSPAASPDPTSITSAELRARRPALERAEAEAVAAVTAAEAAKKSTTEPSARAMAIAAIELAHDRRQTAGEALAALDRDVADAKLQETLQREAELAASLSAAALRAAAAPYELRMLEIVRDLGRLFEEQDAEAVQLRALAAELESISDQLGHRLSGVQCDAFGVSLAPFTTSAGVEERLRAEMGAASPAAQQAYKLVAYGLGRELKELELQRVRGAAISATTAAEQALQAIPAGKRANR